MDSAKGVCPQCFKVFGFERLLPTSGAPQIVASGNAVRKCVLDVNSAALVTEVRRCL